MERKCAKKPKYQIGIVNSGKETVTVKKIYPPGHGYASEKEYGYLIHTTDIGEDELLEYKLTILIAGRQ